MHHNFYIDSRISTYLDCRIRCFSEIEPELKHKGGLHPVELFCNEVAANVLMPVEVMRNLDAAIFNSAKEVFKNSKILGVSTFAFYSKSFKFATYSIIQIS